MVNWRFRSWYKGLGQVVHGLFGWLKWSMVQGVRSIGA